MPGGVGPGGSPGGGMVVLEPMSAPRPGQPASPELGSPLGVIVPGFPHSPAGSPSRHGSVDLGADRFSIAAAIAKVPQAKEEVLSTLAGCQALLRKKDLEINMLRDKLWPIPGAAPACGKRARTSAAPPASLSPRASRTLPPLHFSPRQEEGEFDDKSGTKRALHGQERLGRTQSHAVDPGVRRDGSA